MPTYHLTNWTKNIVFQWMIHIWDPKFYEKVESEISKYKEIWYVYYFEWVRPSEIEWNNEKFDKALWIEFTDDLYSNVSKIYWLVSQDNNKFLWLVNDKDYNVDISLDDIIAEYEKIPKEDKPEEKEAVKINDKIIEELSSLKWNELKLLIELNRWILNFMLKNDTILETLSSNFWNPALFQVILHKRNENLVDYINSSEDKNIYITYWLLHFKWVFELLKESDQKWRITKIEYLYPISKK